jgi:Na+-transporting NADH:ubiquinone oxidoreductase subunit C
VRQSNSYTVIFTVFVAAVAALILSIASQALKDRQITNMELDMKKNILTAVNLMGSDDCKDVMKCYKKYIKELVVDYKGGIIKDASAGNLSLDEELKKKKEQRRFPVFQLVKDKSVESYCLPIVGKGLWSTLYGYIALEKDLITVRGLTFYRHGETPGLGAEIEKSWFLKNFRGKKIVDKKGQFSSVRVVKGKTKKNSPDILNEVDGISGATLTSDGVTKLIKNSLLQYQPMLKKLRKEVK